jgi:hypothetical protein
MDDRFHHPERRFAFGRSSEGIAQLLYGVRRGWRRFLSWERRHHAAEGDYDACRKRLRRDLDIPEHDADWTRAD